MSLNTTKGADKDPTSVQQSGFNFKEGEKVLCYHGPLIYFAKCMQARHDKTTGLVEYHIHYSGWNKSWDEWVPERRVLKINDENLQKQKDLHKAQKSEMGKKNRRKRSVPLTNSPDFTSHNMSGVIIGPGGLNTSFSNTSFDSCIASPPDIKPVIDVKTSTPSTPVSTQDLTESTPKRKKSRISESSSSQDDQTCTKSSQSPSVFNMPDRLKLLLAQDWYNVEENNKLVKLPTMYPVDSIIDDYLKELLSKNPHMKSSEKELVKGVSDYFNAFINPSLLYQLEKLQYDEILKDDPNVCVSKVYGIVHLLRLLVQFPKKLANSSLLTKPRIDHILTKIEPLIGFIESNIDRLLSDVEYESATSEYISKAANYMLEE